MDFLPSNIIHLLLGLAGLSLALVLLYVGLSFLAPSPQKAAKMSAPKLPRAKPIPVNLKEAGAFFVGAAEWRGPVFLFWRPWRTRAHLLHSVVETADS